MPDTVTRPGHRVAPLVPYLIILVVVLVGHWGVFVGHSFLTEEDPVLMHAFTAQNSKSEGWVAAEALGASRFHGDPGAHHIWSPWSFWHRLFADQVFAYNSSILLLLAGAMLAQYALIRRIASSLSPIEAALLASVIIFSPLRHEWFFQRFWMTLTIGSPLVLLILFDFCIRPARRHFFLLSAVLFLALVLGSAAAFIYLGVLCGLLAFVFGFLLLDTLGLQMARARVLAVLKTLALVAGSAACAVLLDAWELYSIVIEKVLVGYVRDPNYIDGGAFVSIPPLRDLLRWCIGALHSGWLSPSMLTSGLTESMPIVSWKNVSPFFPVALLISLHNRPRTPLARACLVVVVTFFMYDGVLMFLPGLADAVQSVVGPYSYPLTKFEPITHTYQIGLLACLLVSLKDPSTTLVISKYVKGLAAFLGMVYSCALVFFVCVATVPGLVERRFEQVVRFLEGRSFIDALSREIAKAVMRQNLAIWEERTVYVQIAFLGLATAGFIYLAAHSGTRTNHKRLSTTAVLCFVVLSNALLAFAVYPMNHDPLVWDMNAKAVEAAIPDLRSSRVVKVVVPCLGYNVRNDQSADASAARTAWKECVLRRFETTDRRYVVGYRNPPALDLSATKSFTQRDVASWMLAILKEEGVGISNIRALSDAPPPLYQSKMYDLAGVKYLYAEREIPDQPRLRLRFAGQNLFIYENLEAWPQLFLAEQVSFSDRVEDMMRATPRHVFLPRAEIPRLGYLAFASPHSPGRIRVDSSRDGYLQLEIDAERESLLVWLEAWHPNWAARLNDKATPILRVNGIFKGVLVPPGSSRLVLQFETASYIPGVVASLVFLALFACAWMRIENRLPFFRKAMASKIDP